MLKAAYAHNIDAYQSVGAEVSKAAREDAADVHVMLGYSKRLTDGALVKARAQNSGLLTLLYESVSIAVLLLLGLYCLLVIYMGGKTLIMLFGFAVSLYCPHIVAAAPILCGKVRQHLHRSRCRLSDVC